MSYNILAVTVIVPELITLQSNGYKMSISISVAHNERLLSAALITTFDNIGIVFRFSTMPCIWLKGFNNLDFSVTIFI